MWREFVKLLLKFRFCRHAVSLPWGAHGQLKMTQANTHERIISLAARCTHTSSADLLQKTTDQPIINLPTNLTCQPSITRQFFWSTSTILWLVGCALRVDFFCEGGSRIRANWSFHTTYWVSAADGAGAAMRNALCWAWLVFRLWSFVVSLAILRKALALLHILTRADEDVSPRVLILLMLKRARPLSFPQLHCSHCAGSLPHPTIEQEVNLLKQEKKNKKTTTTTNKQNNNTSTTGPWHTSLRDERIVSFYPFCWTAVGSDSPSWLVEWTAWQQRDSSGKVRSFWQFVIRLFCRRSNTSGKVVEDDEFRVCVKQTTRGPDQEEMPQGTIPSTPVARVLQRILRETTHGKLRKIDLVWSQWLSACSWKCQ